MAQEALSLVQTAMADAQSYASAAVTAAEAAVASVAAVDIPAGDWTSDFTPELSLFEPTEGPRPGSIAIPGTPSTVTMDSVEKPTKPSLSYPDAPSLTDITIPEIPSIEFPALDIEAPEYDIADPSRFDFDISDILIGDDPLVQAVRTRLQGNIEDGGTGLSEAVEDAIWERDLEREEQQLSDSIDKTMAVWAKTNFSLPDGMIAHSVAEIQKEHYNKMTDRAREIAIKQAELEQTNVFKSMEIAVSLVTQLVSMLIQYEELSIRAQTETAKFANEYITLQIQTYNAKVEAYKAAASIYESRIRANIAKADVYKAQIDGERAKGEVNEQKVRVYAEQYRAIAVEIDAYKSEVNAMVAELEAEKMKIEGNKIQFDVWAKKVDMRIAEYQGEIDAYKAISSIGVATAELMSREAEAQMRASALATELDLKAFEVNEKSIREKAALLLEAQKAIMSATASMAAGAMSAASANASASYSETSETMETE